MRDEDFIRIGIVSGAHGIYGRLKIVVTTAFPDRYGKGKSIYFKEGCEYRIYRVDKFNIHKGTNALLLLDGVTTRDEAERLKGMEIFIPREEAGNIREKLNEDEFLYDDLIGKDVYHNGVCFAVVDHIIEAGGNSILVLITAEQKQYMVPFVESMVDISRLMDGIINVSPVEGLFDI